MGRIGHIVSASGARFPDHFLPYLQFETPQQLIGHATDITRTLDVLADDESRRQFLAHIRFRLQLAFDALPDDAGSDYFSAEFLAPLPEDTTFVDCGAYDGDTIRMFLHRQRDFREIVAFEPDPENYRRLHLRGCAATRDRSQDHDALQGSWRAPGASSVQRDGNMGAAFDNAGDCMVETVPLHDVFLPSAARSSSNSTWKVRNMRRLPARDR